MHYGRPYTRAGILCCNSTAVAVAARQARPHLLLARNYSRGSTPLIRPGSYVLDAGSTPPFDIWQSIYTSIPNNKSNKAFLICSSVLLPFYPPTERFSLRPFCPSSAACFPQLRPPAAQSNTPMRLQLSCPDAIRQFSSPNPDGIRQFPFPF